ncbi:tRNA pseudouridine(55) synthase TruB [Evansella cellulosilytica]|uniref:tRNA pseudouridine synthase B n=1 Tax=Evansella cellulosilytica (strain ATCC 21833 / DSM 2522 / FERM P-1141 / JCM 9156 / N-4) TaxID=649639 RepID=E6TS56_EVAC2|nr:tRNA pseudouridine synthase B [Evansella cellulosilytica DSM 2522]
MKEPIGILPLWKPRGMTSFDAVKEVKKIYHTKRVGHTGTLDPDVDGVLPICLGRATKLVEYLTADKKTYEGEVTLGFSTTTEDASGEVVAEKKVDEKIREEDVRELFNHLIGEITQTPPMYSAIKVKGKRLYEYAREGKIIDRPSRKVSIYHIELVSPVEKTIDKNVKFRFRVTCSKGTYIRTLSVMIGEKFGYPAHMSSLTRTASGQFKKEDCIELHKLRALQEKNEQNDVLMPIELALRHYPKITLPQELEQKVMNGALLPDTLINVDEPLIAMYNQQGECLALYELHPKRSGMLKPAKMLKSV